MSDLWLPSVKCTFLHVSLQQMVVQLLSLQLRTRTRTRTLLVSPLPSVHLHSLLLSLQQSTSLCFICGSVHLSISD